MPDFITKNLSAFITILVISTGGIVSFSRMNTEVEYLKGRVEKLENGQVEVVQLLSKINRRLSLISCKLDASTCLEKD